MEKLIEKLIIIHNACSNSEQIMPTPEDGYSEEEIDKSLDYLKNEILKIKALKLCEPIDLEWVKSLLEDKGYVIDIIDTNMIEFKKNNIIIHYLNTYKELIFYKNGSKKLQIVGNMLPSTRKDFIQIYNYALGKLET